MDPSLGASRPMGGQVPGGAGLANATMKHAATSVTGHLLLEKMQHEERERARRAVPPTLGVAPSTLSNSDPNDITLDLRISDRKLANTIIDRMIAGLKIVKIPEISTNLGEGGWATVGVLAHKSEVMTAKKNADNKYMIFKIFDMNKTVISMFVFGEVSSSLCEVMMCINFFATYDDDVSCVQFNTPF